MTEQIALWWRDDDAIQDTPALRRLVELKRRWRVPLALAVIPAAAERSLAHLTLETDLDILVHGFAHRDHGLPGERKVEFALHRDADEIREELTQGRERLKSMIPQTLPVFVPPWNRFPPERLVEVKASGYVGFSAWGRNGKWPKTEGLIVANAHIDMIDWRSGARAKPVQEVVRELHALAQSGQHTLNAPIGLLTHHLQMSEAAFGNLDRLFHAVSQMPDFVWTGARSIFRGPE